LEETGLKIKKIIDIQGIDYLVEVDEAKPAINGPEQQTASDWYNPEWVVINIALRIENLYPIPIADWFKEIFS